MVHLVTGAAGFIGMHVARSLLDRGDAVIGVDNLNDYYSVRLKRDRLGELERRSGFRFEHLDLADEGALADALSGERVRKVVHLAAQPGVRYSLENPQAYMRCNLVAHLNVLEFCRRHDALEHLTYASSSSVYGGNPSLPYSERQPVDRPISLYAATKKADELISHSYAHLYRIPQTGLRFFTVYGPWGRPEMAVWLFTEALFEGRPIQVFNHGEMRRDFTFIDDIVAGVVAVSDSPPADDGAAPHRIYNIGNNRPEPLMKLIGILEQASGRKAKLEMAPMQPGDMLETYADIDAIRADHGFEPATPIEAGLPIFVDWYRSYRGLD